MKIGLVGLGRMGRAIQARLADRGVEVIGWDRDAVAMKAAADNGMAVAAHPRAVADGADGMVGGKAHDVDAARAVLEKLTRKIVHMGPNGAGYAMKLAANLGLAAFIQATAESLALGTREGLSMPQMIEVLGDAPTANGWFAAKKKLLLGEPDDITLDLKTLRKDMLSAVATGALSGTGMPLSAGVLTALSAAVARGGADVDLCRQSSVDRKSTRLNSSHRCISY